MLFFLMLSFVVFPLTILFLISWIITKNKIYFTCIKYVWGVVFCLILFATIATRLRAKKVLSHKHYYGQYVVDRDFFPGEQADWQYNHFRFEIKRNDSIYFYVTDQQNILKTYRGTIKTTNHKSKRLIIKMEEPGHHILTSNPTTHRRPWSFYMVFYSPKFNNMYFKKGRWVKI